ncbi:MAG: hypothetical protein AB1651_10460 [Pseudomonadota bacterium]
MSRRTWLWWLAAFAGAWSGAAQAEPYLAAREGLKCMQCHVNPSGGGMRTAFGSAYAQTVLAAERIETPAKPWNDALDMLVNIGGDLRVNARYTDVPDQGADSAFETEELRVYLAANVIPQRLTIYADQQLAPGGSVNREAYALLRSADQRYYAKAGRMYLPYGLRLEDDEAFVRLAPGLNMTTPDNGVELGYESAAWSLQAAASNGAGGGTENNEGKQLSLSAAYVQPCWRLGASANYNDADPGDRAMGALFATLRTGALTWLAEADYIDDDSFASGRRTLIAGLLETNWAWRKGHNLKLTGEYFDPDTDVDEDQQARYSLVWEYTPIQFLQIRSGLRVYDGIPQNDLQNRRVGFVQLHGFF